MHKDNKISYGEYATILETLKDLCYTKRDDKIVGQGWWWHYKPDCCSDAFWNYYEHPDYKKEEILSIKDYVREKILEVDAKNREDASDQNISTLCVNR